MATAEVTADALTRLEYGSYLEEEFWEKEYEEFIGRSFPRESYRNIAELLRVAIDRGEGKTWLESVLEENTHTHATHPALKDRLAALGQEPRLPAAIAESAAEVYLGDQLQEVTKQLDLLWKFRAARYADAAAVSHNFAELTRRSKQPDFTADEAYELGFLTEQSENSETALPIFREAVRLNPNHAAANLATGRILLSQDREEGIAFAQRAMQIDPDLTASSSGYLSMYYTRKGDPVTSNSYLRRSTDYWKVFEKARAERRTASFVDHFMSHTMSAREIEQIRRELAQDANIKSAYLVRKEVRYLPRNPLHALGVVLDRRWYKKPVDDLTFTAGLPQTRKKPPELYVFVLDYRNRQLGKIIRDVGNSLIYQRNLTH